MSIDAMKQALEALEETESALARCVGPHKAEEGDRHRALAKSRAAIPALRLAIEQAERQAHAAPPQQTCNGMPAYEGPLSAGQKRQPLTEAQRQQRDGINSPNRGSLGGAHD
jgi:hypothetical protein